MGYFEEKKYELESLVRLIQKEAENLEKRASEERRYLDTKRASLLTEQHAINALSKERQIGFPWLARAFEELQKLTDQRIAYELKIKKHPALKASERVKEETTKRREAERQLKIANYLIEYYENIAPFLIDLREEVDLPSQEDQENLRQYSEEEREDRVTDFLTIEEYRKLSVSDKNQLALDRYWQRSHSKAHIGKMYERYVGYLFEEQGYDVEYVGIFKGFEDLGRDLICKKGNELVVIQCKNWSQFRTIYEKHIFQFFGTVFEYKDKNPGKKITAQFVTSTKLSDLARRFSKELGIELKESFKLDKSYPCIKCNVSNVDKTKIYHLPFDQMYDNVKIEPHKGEFYCKTVKEAEAAGFRRAFKYRFST